MALFGHKLSEVLGLLLFLHCLVERGIFEIAVELLQISILMTPTGNYTEHKEYVTAKMEKRCIAVAAEDSIPRGELKELAVTRSLYQYSEPPRESYHGRPGEQN